MVVLASGAVGLVELEPTCLGVLAVTEKEALADGGVDTLDGTIAGTESE